MSYEIASDNNLLLGPRSAFGHIMLSPSNNQRSRPKPNSSPFELFFFPIFLFFFEISCFSPLLDSPLNKMAVAAKQPHDKLIKYEGLDGPKLPNIAEISQEGTWGNSMF